MGTNYYLCEKPPCPHCGRPYERKHIGKSSAGWCFTLHVIPEEGINDLEDWQRIWAEPGAQITNEYGEAVSVDDMVKTVTARTWSSRDKMSGGWYQDNYAQLGPNGLARHAIGTVNGCIKHGAGTWDCIVGDFS